MSLDIWIPKIVYKPFREFREASDIFFSKSIVYKPIIIFERNIQNFLEIQDYYDQDHDFYFNSKSNQPIIYFLVFTKDVIFWPFVEEKYLYLNPPWWLSRWAINLFRPCKKVLCRSFVQIYNSQILSIVHSLRYVNENNFLQLFWFIMYNFEEISMRQFLCIEKGSI